MSAVSIPDVGEIFTGSKPQAIKIAKVSIGVAAANDVVFDAQETLAIFNVPANCLVVDMWAYTPTAWTASVTLDAGDGDDPNGWLATAKVAPTSAQTDGLAKRSTKATAEAYAGGKLYLVADTIDIVIGGATPLVGQSDIYMAYIENVSAL